MKVPAVCCFSLESTCSVFSLPSPSWFIRIRWLNNFANKRAPQRLMGTVWVSINYCNRRQVLIKYDRRLQLSNSLDKRRREGGTAAALDNKQSFCPAAKSCLRDAKVFCWSPASTGEHIKIKSGPTALRTRAPRNMAMKLWWRLHARIVFFN